MASFECVPIRYERSWVIQRLGGLQNLRSQRHVPPHDRQFAWCERRGFRQQRLGHRHFADVVKARRQVERRMEFAIDAHFLSNRLRVAADSL